MLLPKGHENLLSARCRPPDAFSPPPLVGEGVHPTELSPREREANGGPLPPRLVRVLATTRGEANSGGGAAEAGATVAAVAAIPTAAG